MIKAIIFDFDGVIIESADIKTKAFASIFADYPDKVNEIVAYHETNTGISRFVKFRYFYEQLLGQQLSIGKEKELGERFSQIVLDEILTSPLVNGVEDFLNENSDRYMCFIASGTPQEELRYITNKRNLSGFFKGIYGTPATKSAIILRILSEGKILQSEVVFVGDAESDKIAAAETGVHFVARVKTYPSSLNKCTWKIRDFTELKMTLERILPNKDIK